MEQVFFRLHVRLIGSVCALTKPNHRVIYERVVLVSAFVSLAALVWLHTTYVNYSISSNNCLWEAIYGNDGINGTTPHFDVIRLHISNKWYKSVLADHGIHPSETSKFEATDECKDTKSYAEDYNNDALIGPSLPILFEEFVSTMGMHIEDTQSLTPRSDSKESRGRGRGKARLLNVAERLLMSHSKDVVAQLSRDTTASASEDASDADTEKESKAAAADLGGSNDLSLSRFFGGKMSKFGRGRNKRDKIVESGRLFDLFFSQRVYLFSIEKGYLMLKPEVRERHNITRLDITIARDSACFGPPAAAWLVHTFVGYDTVVMNWAIATFGGKGYLYNIFSKELFNLNFASDFMRSTGSPRSTYRGSYLFSVINSLFAGNGTQMTGNDDTSTPQTVQQGQGGQHDIKSSGYVTNAGAASVSKPARHQSQNKKEHMSILQRMRSSIGWGDGDDDEFDEEEASPFDTKEPSILAGLQQFLAFKLGVLFTTIFLFFTTTTLVSFTLRETQERMLKFTFLLNHHISNHIPYAPLVFTHVVESLVFVPIMVGILFFLFEFFSDQLLAFMVLSVVWLCEVYSVVCLRTVPSIRSFPRIFFFYFCLFLVYFFSFPFGFSYLALFTTVLFLQHFMMYVWNAYEIPALENGLVTAVTPRIGLSLATQDPQLQPPYAAAIVPDIAQIRQLSSDGNLRESYARHVELSRRIQQQQMSAMLGIRSPMPPPFPFPQNAQDLPMHQQHTMHMQYLQRQQQQEQSASDNHPSPLPPPQQQQVAHAPSQTPPISPFRARMMSRIAGEGRGRANSNSSAQADGTSGSTIMNDMRAGRARTYSRESAGSHGSAARPQQSTISPSAAVVSTLGSRLGTAFGWLLPRGNNRGDGDSEPETAFRTNSSRSSGRQHVDSSGYSSASTSVNETINRVSGKMEGLSPSIASRNVSGSPGNRLIPGVGDSGAGTRRSVPFPLININANRNMSTVSPNRMRLRVAQDSGRELPPSTATTAAAVGLADALGVNRSASPTSLSPRGSKYTYGFSEEYFMSSRNESMDEDLSSADVSPAHVFYSRPDSENSAPMIESDKDTATPVSSYRLNVPMEETGEGGRNFPRNMPKNVPTLIARSCQHTSSITPVVNAISPIIAASSLFPAASSEGQITGADIEIEHTQKQPQPRKRGKPGHPPSNVASATHQRVPSVNDFGYRRSQFTVYGDLDDENENEDDL